MLLSGWERSIITRTKKEHKRKMRRCVNVECRVTAATMKGSHRGYRGHRGRRERRRLQTCCRRKDAMVSDIANAHVGATGRSPVGRCIGWKGDPGSSPGQALPVAPTREYRFYIDKSGSNRLNCGNYGMGSCGCGPAALFCARIRAGRAEAAGRRRRRGRRRGAPARS